MNYLIKISLSFSFFLFSFTAFTQVENYQPATIVNNQDKVINGFIYYKDWRQNPNEVSFKKELDSDIVNYKAEEIKSFEVANRQYISEAVVFTVDRNEEEFEEYLDTLDTFLEVIINGEKDLLLYKDGGYRSHFFISQLGEIEYLYRGFDLVYAGTNVKVEPRAASPFVYKVEWVEDSYYITQLEKAFSQCPALQPIIANLTYEREAFVEIFRAYHECKKQKIRFEKKIAQDKVVFNLLGGVTATYFNVIGAPTYQGTSKHWVHGIYPLSKQFTGGIGVELVIPGKFGQNRFLNEIMYKGLSLQGTWSQNGTMSIEENRVREFELKIDFIKMNMLYKQKRQISPTTTFFFNAGISHNFGFERINEMLEEASFFGTVTSNEYVALRDLNTYHLGLIGGFGFGYKRFSGELRYEFGNDISKLTIVTSTTHSGNLIFGYRLN